jgi:hypothetical protein
MPYGRGYDNYARARRWFPDPLAAPPRLVNRMQASAARKIWAPRQVNAQNLVALPKSAPFTVTAARGEAMGR